MKSFPRVKESAVYRTAYFLASLAVLLLDQWTKGIVVRSFQLHESRPVIPGFFDLTYVQNSGAAFGLFASVDSSLKAIVLNSVAVIVFLIVSAYALRSSHKSVRLQVGLALILAFSAGLAATITGIGLVAVLARRAFGRLRLDGPVIRALPAVSALLILAVGLGITLNALPEVL